eukprot:4247098-Lingulodinium_polyedra.AAC.1
MVAGATAQQKQQKRRVLEQLVKPRRSHNSDPEAGRPHHDERQGTCLRPGRGRQTPQEPK